MRKSLFGRWRANFFTGLAILLPAIASVVVLVFFFSRVANVTDTLLFFLPSKLTHKNAGEGPMYWYWSLAALVLAVLLVSLTGRLTRYYVGVKMVELLDHGLHAGVNRLTAEALVELDHSLLAHSERGPLGAQVSQHVARDS